MGYYETIRYLKGYVTLWGDGVFTERFVNICIRRNLEIWDIQRLGQERISAKMSVSSFKQIRQICRRTKTRVRIVKRHGMPFFMKRMKRRKGAVLGIMAVIAVMWYTTGHIMGITVFGNNRIPTETVLEHLEQSGIALGKTTSGIDTDKIRNKMMIDLNDLAWVGINVTGSRVYVEVVERIEKEEGVDLKVPCHLVATRDGIIHALKVRNGQTMVKEKAGVREGDVLVSGVVDNPVSGFNYVHAYGEVYALTEYKKTAEYPLEYIEKSYTGKSKKRYTFKVLNKEIPLFIGKKEPYEIYEADEEEKEYRLMIESLPSVYVKKEIYRQQTEGKKKRTAIEAAKVGKEELEKELRLEIGEKEIKEIKATDTLTERGTVEVSVTVVCCENIAREVPIEIDTDP